MRGKKCLAYSSSSGDTENSLGFDEQEFGTRPRLYVCTHQHTSTHAHVEMQPKNVEYVHLSTS